MKRRFLLASVLLASCASAASGESADAVVFEFVHPTHEERFRAATSDAAVIAAARAQLALPLAERTLHINGDIEAGDDGVNAAWSWHFVRSAWSLAEISAEVCDGWPGYIEENLDAWLASPGFFCPWSSRVSAEIP